MNVVLKIGQGFLAAFDLGLFLEQKDGQGPKQGQIASGRGIADRAAVPVLGAIAPIVLPVFDAPMIAGQLEQGVGVSLLWEVGGDGKTDVVGFLDDFALAHMLRVAVDAHDLSHAGQAHGLGIGGHGPQFTVFNTSVLFIQAGGLRGERRRAAVARL